MNLSQRITKNIGVKITAEIISKILGFFFIIYVARYLGAEGFGVLSFALAFTAIFGILANFGLRPLIVREVARNKSLARKYLGNILAMKIILIFIVFGLIFLALNLLDYPSQTIKVVYLVALFMILNAFSEIFNSFFQAFEKVEYISIGMILQSGLLLSGALFVINRGFDILSFGFLYSFVGLVVLIYSFIILIWKFVKPTIIVDFSFWKSIIKGALPFGLIGVSEIIYHWSDTVMLSAMKGDAVVGWYNAAYRLFLVALLVPSTFYVAIFPVMSRFYISAKNSLKFICWKYFKYITIIGVFIGVGVTLFADEIILTVFGLEYQPSIIALQILIWSAVLIFVNGAFVNLFEAINRQIMITKICGGAAVLNVGLNLLLIPKYSYVGAGIATVMSEFLITLSVIVLASRTQYKIQSLAIINQLLRLSASGLAMGVFIVYFSAMNFISLVIFSIVIYLGVLYLVGGLNKKDLILIKQIAQKR